MLDDTLKWKYHIQHVVSKINKTYFYENNKPEN